MRRRGWTVITGLMLCVACGGDRERPSPEPRPASARVASDEDDEARARKAVMLVTAKAEAALDTWATTEFANRAEGAEALMRAISPKGPAARQSLDAALSEIGLSHAAFMAAMRKSPELLRWAHAEFARVGAASLARVGGLGPKLSALPPGDTAEFERRAAELSRGAHILPSPPAPPDPLASWVEVHTSRELLQQVQEAARSGRPVVIHFRATWALPTRELEQGVLAAPEVSTILAGYQRVFVDVSDADRHDDALQDALGAATLPAIQVYRDPSALADALAGGKELPAPAVVVDRVVDAATFARALAE